MSVAQLASRIHTGSKSEPPLWLTQGFRPFFFVAAIWSIGALAIWIAMLATGRALPSIFDPLSWHIHEMLFGFGLAAAAGFLLTAVPNWTKRPAVSGKLLASLVGLWLIGRLACAFSVFMPAWLGSVLDLAFPVALIAILAREIIASRNWRNLVMLAPLAVLAAADLLMHIEASGGNVPAGLGWRLGFSAMIVLMAVVGGRLIPTFTGNWLAKRDIALPAQVQQHAWLAPASIAALSVGLLGWAALPDSHAFGAVLLIGGVLNISKLARWRGLATGSEPLLFILHVAYLWVVVGVFLLGLASFGVVPQSAAIHALTAGAMGTMILAVMTRVARGHSGQSLTADTITRWIYGLVTLAAVFRVIAAFAASGPGLLLYAAAILWIAAYAVFLFAYSPTLLMKRRVG
jgi:uncharacterized protein involved in response to NO